jgi:CHAT domain-containing protein
LQPGNEIESFLLLGKGAQLTVLHIKSLPNIFQGVDLLTLSACQTGVTASAVDGTEVEGFAVLAQRQGAKGIIASLWRVADASTGLLMQRFYQLRNAEPHLSKAEALQKAQLALLSGEVKAEEDSGKNYSHPFFWAPFVLTGNWR